MYITKVFRCISMHYNEVLWGLMVCDLFIKLSRELQLSMVNRINTELQTLASVGSTFVLGNKAHQHHVSPSIYFRPHHHISPMLLCRKVMSYRGGYGTAE